MRKKIGCGLPVVIALIAIYASETAILGFIYHFLSQVPYKLVAPPVVVVAMFLAWVMLFVDMKKGGKR